jgi:hypothetical protein
MRRLRLSALAAHLGSPTAAATPAAAPLPAVVESDLGRAMSVGTLSAATIERLPAETVADLMRRSVGAPTEHESVVAENQDLFDARLPDVIVAGDGTVSAEALDKLRQLQDEAVAVEDFEAAAQFQRLRTVLGPRPPLPPSECAPLGLEAQTAFFWENGFVMVENVLEGAELAACQAGVGALLPAAMAKWETQRASSLGVARHTFAYTPEGVEKFGSRKDFGLEFEALLSMEDDGVAPGLSCIDSEKIYPLVRRLVHPAPEDQPEWTSFAGDVTCAGMGISIYPPDEDGAGYTFWVSAVTIP